MMLRATIIGVLLIWTVQGQSPATGDGASGIEIKIEKRGRMAFVTLKAEAAPIRDVLVQLGAKLGLQHRFYPGAPRVMEGETIPISVELMPASELIFHLAGVIGLEGKLVDGLIEVRPPPEVGSQGAKDWARRHAIDAWMKNALTASSASGADLLYRTGLLHLAGEEWTEAISDLERFAVVEKADARAPRALVLAADAALRADDVSMHENLLERITKEYADIDEVMHAHLRKARLLIDRREFAAALPLIERVESDAIDRRLRVIAILMRAELWFEKGDGEVAMQVLSSFDIDRQREHPDLAESVPLYEGLSLILAQAYERALPRLQVCLLSEQTELRIRAALALARCCLAIDQSFAAYQNVRIALNQNPKGRLLVEAHLIEAEILIQLGLTDRALNAYERLAKNLPTDASDGLQVHLLEGTAQLLYRRREFKMAARIWKTLASRHGKESESRLQVARCLIELGRHQDAVIELDKIPADAKNVDLDAIATLRGNCFIELGEYAKAAMAFGSSRKATSKKPLVEKEEDDR